jgi:RNA recognition motif 2
MTQEQKRSLACASDLPTKDTFVHFSAPKEQRERSMTMPYLSVETHHLNPTMSPTIDTPNSETPTTTTEDYHHQATSVMLRHIPNKYGPELLKNDILEAGFSNKMDFFYMPVDMESKCNLGYCFLNFKTPQMLDEFRDQFDGQKLPHFVTHKVCQVSVARVQGLKANLEHLSKSAAVRSLPEEYKPTIFDGASQIPYPPASEAPTVIRTRAPRHRTY